MSSQSFKSTISKFYFKNFEPDFELRRYGEQCLEAIEESAPSDGAVVAILEPVSEGFRCSVDIYSSYGPFMASVVEETPREAIRHIEQKIHAQLARWKVTRFSAEGEVPRSASA